MLFESNRVVGRGEYRGLEFLEVESKRIINEVPASSRMPFRWTINAYRGCSHACVYCLAGDTPVLMADGRIKPISEVVPGDVVYGTTRRGPYRRYVPTVVLDHWSTVKTAHRIALEDGTELIASGDHRFLTDRGWKHVTGDEQGRARRPHLTTNNSLLGVGRLMTTPKETIEYRQGYLCGLIRGDGSLGTYLTRRPSGGAYLAHRFRLALADSEALDRAHEYLAGFGVGTTSFSYAPATDTTKALNAIRTQSKAGVEAIGSLVRWPDIQTAEWARGFLAGIFDAEGSHSGGTIRISNIDPTILQRISQCLSRFGFRHCLEANRRSDVKVVRVRGGLVERLRFFHTVDPAITRKRTIDNLALKSTAPLTVNEIEPLGFEMPMYDITTGTGDFIADGVVSHNCFARPTHGYLDLDPGRDFESKIVVKTNAVELARAETAPHRWRGDPIAMGTNTDPYQAAEGKYRLTRGIIEVLAERTNPFSILTKSPLVLRDLDVLVDAAAGADVKVDFSIGTLDEEVWKATEPGTPHPRKRVEAVAKLTAAGIRSGVLVAPILPGLSDDPEQVRRVVSACLEAGASYVTPILLHLRPGVRELYMEWLARERPDLVAAHQEMYRRAYPPQADRDRLAAAVADLVRQAGGTERWRPRASRPKAWRPEQLRLL